MENGGIECAVLRRASCIHARLADWLAAGWQTKKTSLGKRTAGRYVSPEKRFYPYAGLFVILHMLPIVPGLHDPLVAWTDSVRLHLLHKGVIRKTPRPVINHILFPLICVVQILSLARLLCRFDYDTFVFLCSMMAKASMVCAVETWEKK
jgi:hypothetical protein